ncbi:hypothetical protein DICPUDRAFT_93198 [Dictyostelium purpureum]|uniref:Equilibrative nucleoside transporter n=1 Tax=Dictyostelium purpureum TaxID=5786 RepID=F1A3S1_DICPU|nr:uncharacterized protein DICPUDRAFT_93198 [Dictyostelium purpureum]EGC29161.1 hypothetical protein DICPUDRAFT_93198 [Dictyostelium purpureum]|eukprot:XP_003294314.1 hypothetical protein DICPUDRAFT_93198 [Dictyostelium purpureum]
MGIEENIASEESNMHSLANKNNNNLENEIFSSSSLHIKEDEVDRDDDYNPVLGDDIDFKTGSILIVLTIALLFPYQSFLSALDYFAIIYPDLYSSSTIPFVYMVMLTIAFIVVLRFSNKINHKYNILFGFMVFVVTMIIIPLLNLTKVGGSFGSYIVTVVLIGVASFFDGLVQTSVYAIAGLFGPQYSISCQVGNGLSGVIVIVIRIIIKLSFKDQDQGNKIGVIVFFSVGVVFIIFAGLLFIHLLRSPLGEIIMKKNKKKDIELKNNEVDNTFSQNADIKTVNPSPLRYVWNNNYQYFIPVSFIFILTLLLFPSIIMQIPLKSIPKDWSMVAVIAVFNLFDFVGKSVPLFYKRKNYSLKLIWFLSFSRTIFIILFFISIYIKSFRDVSMVFIFIAIFAFTNGYTASICMAEAPKRVLLNYKELSSIFISFGIDLGLLMGAVLNLILTLLLKFK